MNPFIFATTLLTLVVLTRAQVSVNDLNLTFVDLPSLSRQSQDWVQQAGMRGCNYANQVRSQYGRHALYYSASLTNNAVRHSRWMAYYFAFQHQNINGMGVRVGHHWMPLTAENIAMSSPRSTDPAWDAHQQWFHSRGHFLNMISPYHTHCGVGIAYDRYGRWWGTQVFGYNSNFGHEYGGGSGSSVGSRPAAAAPAPAPAAPAPAPAPAAPAPAAAAPATGQGVQPGGSLPQGSNTPGESTGAPQNSGNSGNRPAATPLANGDAASMLGEPLSVLPTS